VNDLHVLWLPLAAVALAVVALVAEVLDLPTAKPSRSPLGALAVAGLLGIFGASFFVHAEGSAAFGAYEASAWSLYLQRLFLVAGVLGVLAAQRDLLTRTPRRQGEYVLLTPHPGLTPFHLVFLSPVQLPSVQ